MDIEKSGDYTELLIEKAKAEANDQDVYPLITQTGLELLKSIPGMGHVLAAGEQLHTRRRVEYLEISAEELRQAAEELSSRVGSIERTVNDERLAGLIYDGFGRAVQAQTDAQRRRTMRAVRNAVLSAGEAETDYNEQAWMLRLADEMYDPDVDILVYAFRAAEKGTLLMVDDIPGDDDMQLAAFERLRSFGFITPLDTSSALRAHSRVREGEISSLGKRFVEYALDDAVS